MQNNGKLHQGSPPHCLHPEPPSWLVHLFGMVVLDLSGEGERIDVVIHGDCRYVLVLVNGVVLIGV